MSRHRIAVVTADPVAARMPGPSIRAWHIASHLAGEHDVQLVTTQGCDRSHSDFTVRHIDPVDVAALDRWADVIVFQGGLLRDHPFLAESDTVLVADVYDPFHLENLEQEKSRPLPERRAAFGHLAAVLNEQLRRGDFFLCASRRQRDFWLGSLTTLGRVNPDVYDLDPALDGLIAVVPFGLPSEPPVHSGGPAIRGAIPGIGDDDPVVLWAGGVYDWFDPLSAVRAIDRLRHRVPDVRLVFMGMQHPNPNIPAMPIAGELRRLAERTGLGGKHVFFNDTWVDYDRRADYLLEAKVGLTTHLGHIETAFSFRTRTLDYIWAGLPIVTTGGDTLADLVAAEDLGRVTPPADDDAVASALEELLTDPAAAARCRDNMARVAPRFRWESVLAPLVEFCRAPRRAPDLVVAGAAVASSPAPSVRQLASRWKQRIGW